LPHTLSVACEARVGLMLLAFLSRCGWEG